jgi:hypothetical protein
MFFGIPRFMAVDPGRTICLVTSHSTPCAVNPVMSSPFLSLDAEPRWPNASYSLTSIDGSRGMPFASSIRPHELSSRCADEVSGRRRRDERCDVGDGGLQNQPDFGLIWDQGQIGVRGVNHASSLLQGRDSPCGPNKNPTR